MTEKEKMLLGELYNPNFDEELINERNMAKDKCFEYNNIKPSNLEERKECHPVLLFTITGSGIAIGVSPMSVICHSYESPICPNTISFTSTCCSL